MVDEAASTVSHLLSKRSDPQLTLGLAVGFGATALVLTAFISFLLGHYFGRRAALNSLGKDREGTGTVSNQDMAIRRRSKLRSTAGSYDRGTKTTSGYSYTGVTTTDIESIRTEPSITMQARMPAASSEPRMPINASELNSSTTNPDFGGTIYGSWYGGGIGGGARSSPGHQSQASASMNVPISTSPPHNLRPGALVSSRPFTHGTPLTQISESTSSSAWSQPSPPQTHQRVSYVDSGAATGILPAVDTDTLQTPPSSAQHAHAATLPTRGAAAPAPILSAASTPSPPGADINRSPTTSEPPSYAHHEFPGAAKYSSFSSVIQNEAKPPTTSSKGPMGSLNTASNSASSSSKKPDRRSSVVFGPRAAKA